MKRELYLVVTKDMSTFNVLIIRILIVNYYVFFSIELTNKKMAFYFKFLVFVNVTQFY